MRVNINEIVSTWVYDGDTTHAEVAALTPKQLCAEVKLRCEAARGLAAQDIFEACVWVIDAAFGADQWEQIESAEEGEAV